MNKNGIFKNVQVVHRIRKKKRKTENKQKTKSNLADFSPNVSIIKLNVNGLNISVKRQRLSERIKKHDPVKCCL